MNKKYALITVTFIFLGLLISCGNRLYQSWQFLRSVKNEVWRLDEEHQIHYSYPPNWEVDYFDEGRVIHPESPYPDRNGYGFLWVNMRVVSPDELTGTNLPMMLDEFVPSYLASVKDYTIIESTKSENFDTHDAATINVSTELFTTVDESIAGLFEEKGEDPTLVVDRELTLVDYNGIMLFIETVWRPGDPKFNSKNYRLLRNIREGIYLHENLAK